MTKKYKENNVALKYMSNNADKLVILIKSIVGFYQHIKWLTQNNIETESMGFVDSRHVESVNLTWLTINCCPDLQPSIVCQL